MGTPLTAEVGSASNAQYNYLVDLMANRQWIGYVSDDVADVCDRVAKYGKGEAVFIGAREARETIQTLLKTAPKIAAQPVRTTVSTPAPRDQVVVLGMKDLIEKTALLDQLPESRYAMFRPDMPKERFFFQVKTSKQSNRKYIVRIYRTPGHWQSKMVEAKDVMGVLRAISKNPAAYAKAYADTTGECGRCRIALTDPVSVARGFGPTCVKYFQ
jgi:hypothetical protein